MRKRHGIKSIRSPILQNHATPGEDPIVEYSDMVVATDAMPPEDFRRSVIFSWITQAFHSMGPTRDIATYLKGQGVPYQKFYEGLMLENSNTIMGQQVAAANRCLDRALAGGEWTEIDPKYGNVTWPFEEISFLDIATGDLGLFYKQVEEMVNRRFITLPRDIIQRQRARLRTPEEFGGDIPEYARRVAWFGRKFGFALKNLEKEPGNRDSIPSDLYVDLDSMPQSGN